MASTHVDVGFVEQCDEWKLSPRFFPSKVGGKPAWLNLKSLPQPIDIQCGKCKEPCIFLCQMYAPIDNMPEAFHRTLFVFVCKNPTCCSTNNSDNFLVFRCQLQRSNEYYSFDPPTEDRNEILDYDKWSPLCKLCGSKGPNHCSKCKKSNYCSRSHQIIDWKNGHKDICNGETVNSTEAKNCLLFPQWELIIDEESEELSKERSEEEELKYLSKLIEEKKAGTLIDENETELEQYANKAVEDKTFEKFKQQISRDPGQVLRYNRGGSPLWISAKPIPEEIPNCPICHSKRQFECQIMPQLLNFLNLDAINCIDWGILAIYTCEKHCDSGIAYKKEFIFKQDVSQVSALN